MRCLMPITRQHLFRSVAPSLPPAFEPPGRSLPQRKLVSHPQGDLTSWTRSPNLSTPSTRPNAKLSEPQLCSSLSNSSYSKPRSGTSINSSKPSATDWTTLSGVGWMLTDVRIGSKIKFTYHRSSTRPRSNGLSPAPHIVNHLLLRPYQSPVLTPPTRISTIAGKQLTGMGDAAPGLETVSDSTPMMTLSRLVQSLGVPLHAHRFSPLPSLI